MPVTLPDVSNSEVKVAGSGNQSEVTHVLGKGQSQYGNGQ
jgi:hypothetical protein